MTPDLFAVRSLLFLPASNPRAVAKARTLDADMVVLDLEDGRMRHRCALHLGRADALAGDLERVIGSALDEPVAVLPGRAAGEASATGVVTCR